MTFQDSLEDTVTRRSLADCIISTMIPCCIIAVGIDADRSGSVELCSDRDGGNELLGRSPCGTSAYHICGNFKPSRRERFSRFR